MSSSTVSIDRRAAAEPPSAESQPFSQRSYAREDFEFGSLLGIGALAQVVHVRDSYTGEEYALKILDKKQLRRVCYKSCSISRFASLAKLAR
jgi:3-phosphoinositide dependent protein kinase-1